MRPRRLGLVPKEAEGTCHRAAGTKAKVDELEVTKTRLGARGTVRVVLNSLQRTYASSSSGPVTDDNLCDTSSYSAATGADERPRIG